MLADLVELLKKEGRPRKPSPWVDELNHTRARFWEESRAALHSGAVPIKPQRIIHELNQRLPSPAIVIADAGTPTPYITRFLKLQGGGSRFLIPRAFGGLGYAIPAVVGAAFASPGTRVVGLFGDGSLGMTAGELETLVRMNIPAVLIHFNNGSFGWIKALQALHCKGKFLSVDFTAGDMARVAEGFGLKAFHIENPEELEKGLDEAFNAQTPVFLDVVTESELSELPPVYSWLKKAEEIGRNPLPPCGGTANKNREWNSCLSILSNWKGDSHESCNRRRRMGRLRSRYFRKETGSPGYPDRTN